MRVSASTALCFFLASACSSPAPHVQTPRPARLEYPPARRSDQVDLFHGVSVADPYRWMEQLDSPETHAWIEAERRVTEGYFKDVPSRDRLAKELAAAYDFERVSPPDKRGGKYFFSKNSGLQNQPILYVADSLAGQPRALIDFNEVSPDGKLAFAGLTVSPRGTYVAYGLSIGGSDWTEWRIREVATGRDLPDRLEWTKYYAPAWTRDEKGLYYSRFPQPAVGQEITARDLDCKVRLHRLDAGGKDAAAKEDPVVFESTDHPTWQYDVKVTDDGHWLVITVGDGQVGDRGLEAVHVLDLEKAGAKPKALVDGFDAEYLPITSDGSKFIVKTNSGAPNGRVVAIDARDPKPSSWKTIIPTGDHVIEAVARAGDRLLVATLVDVSTRLNTYSLDGRALGEVALPGIGSAYPVDGQPGDKEAFYVYTSFTAPRTIYRYDMATGKSEPFHPPRAVIDPANFEVEQVRFTSKDGTQVPMFVVHKKGMKRDGSNPTYLTGYGGFGVSISPLFSPSWAWWLQMGGVLAIPSLRGGGEYGEAWHQAAMKTHKQTTFDDFIAAAEWLIANKITSTKKLAIEGGSGGGLLVGAAMTQRPDLFGAVVINVGVLDMLRFHLVGQGEGWQGDFGSPDVPDEFRALLAYSPLHNVKPGTSYPPLLVVTGENDTRVAPWHSYKFLAAVQAAQAGPAPALLNLEAVAGHGGGTTLDSRVQNLAVQYAFMLHALGVKLP